MVKASEKPSGATREAARLPGADHLPLIGLVGGIASGKSVVARQLRELGAALLDADRAGHDVLLLPEVETAARQRWGETIFGDDGHVDRARLARIVFDPSPRGSTEREYLERLTHPRIGQMIRLQAARFGQDPGTQALVLDAPVMMESGWDSICDHVLFVDARSAIRAERARARGWSDEEFRTREGVQASLDRKRARADVVIDNSGSLESARTQVEQFWRRITATAPVGAQKPAAHAANDL